jgi:prepilin-type N-terminal cleavage/methylation domain-containing protein
MCNYKTGARRITARRAAFTFVELLVVLAIILILIGLTAAAAVGVIRYQLSSNTETELRTLDGGLDQQWKAAIKKAMTEPINPSDPTTWNRLLTMAAGNNAERRARLIWVKLRLKQEFPMNFSEVLNASGPLGLPAGYSLAPLIASDLAAKPSYLKLFAAQGITAGVASPSPYVWPTESSVTLPMALELGRSGITFPEDSLPASALTLAGQKPAGLSPAIDGYPSSPPLPGPTYPKQFVDAWGRPIVFYRWPRPLPTGSNPDDSALDSASPQGSTPGPRDPMDPEGLLLDPTWNNWASYSAQSGGVWLFEQLCHPVHSGNSAATYAPISYYMKPVIVSSGKGNDGSLGLVQFGNPNQVSPAPSPLLPDNMNIDNSATNQSRYDQDNIYSYTLR